MKIPPIGKKVVIHFYSLTNWTQHSKPESDFSQTIVAIQRIK